MRATLAGMVVAMATWSGCGCTEMGCAASLVLDIQGITEGVIEYAVTGPTSTDACTFELPASELDCSDSWMRASVKDDGFQIQAKLEATHLRVSVDGVVVIDEDLDPEPTEPFYPNGKRCGGSCTGATQAFIVEAS